VVFSSPFPIYVPQLIAGKTAFGKARRYKKLKTKWHDHRTKNSTFFSVNITTLPGQLRYATSNRGILEYVSKVWETKTELQDFPNM
jgi:hypothetical protein